MKTFFLTLFAVAALVLGGSQALAATKHHHAAPKTLVVGMRDPGCHWFLIHGKYLDKAAVAGPVKLANRDEATLKVASRNGVKLVKVGKSLLLERGHYVVMMVGQAVDDNYLKLTVR